MIRIEMHEEYSFSFSCSEVCEAVLKEVLQSEGCPYEAEVSLVLTDEEEIRKYNREYRGIDRETDVLSFPAVDFYEPSDFSGIEEMKDIYVDPDSDRLVLGDVMICVSRMREQAAEYGHGEKREFAFLFAHSIFHLLGYDHMEADEAAVMEAKQREALERLGITR